MYFQRDRLKNVVFNVMFQKNELEGDRKYSIIATEIEEKEDYHLASKKHKY